MTESKNERHELLALYEDLRVADVRDGMDWNVMHHYGSMSYRIRPLFRTRVLASQERLDMSPTKDISLPYRLKNTLPGRLTTIGRFARIPG